MPRGSYVWNDIIAINQHGDAGADVRARVTDGLNSLEGVRVRVRVRVTNRSPNPNPNQVTDDLNSLEGVIKHTGKVLLFFHPIEKPAAVSPSPSPSPNPHPNP